MFKIKQKQVDDLKAKNGLALDIQDVYKKYKNIEANKGVTLQIKTGERVALLGANGAGKTTIVSQVVGLEKPTSGKILRNFGKASNYQDDLGIQFQDAKYPEGLSCRDIIDFFSAVSGEKLKKSELDSLIKIFMIEEFIENPADSLSGGQAQKLNVLLSVVNNPTFLILDEVSTGLDVKARKEIKDYVQKYMDNKERTLLLISHDMAEVEQLCERIVVMKQGKVVLDEPVKEIKKKHESLDKFLEELIGH